MLCGGKAKTARRRQLRFVEDADDEGETARAQSLLHRPESIGGPCRFREQPGRGLNAHGSQAMAIGNAEFAREEGWPAPQDVHRGTLDGIDAAQPAYGEA